MNCLKCGREISEGQVFCEDCRLEMEKYPIKPGIPIQLPRRVEAPPVKKVSRRRVLTAEEQVKILRRISWILALLLLVMTLLAAALAYPAVQYLMEDHFLPGQNYSSVTDNTPSQNGELSIDE